MPPVIEPSERALADFDRIYDAIAQRNPSAAASVLRDLDKSIESAQA